MASAEPGTKGRLLGLDGLRGVAAIVVMLYHYTLRPSEWTPMGGAGVEVFFVISGFILAYAYEDVLDAGMSAAAYAIQRGIRLYPVYLLGLAFGFVVYGLETTYRGGGNPPAAVAGALARGVALIPTFHPFTVGLSPYLDKQPLYPFDNPAWSLLIEVACSAAFFVWRPRGRALAWTLAALAALLLGVTVNAHSIGGASQGNFWRGYPRGLFCFYAGLGVYRLWRAGALERLPRAPAVALAALAAGACLNVSLFIYFGTVFAGAPLLVALATGAPGGRGAQRAFAWLGDVSYPLYLLHGPLFALARVAAVAMGWPAGDPPPAVAIPALAALALGLATVAARYFDAPVRRGLRGMARAWRWPHFPVDIPSRAER